MHAFNFFFSPFFFVVVIAMMICCLLNLRVSTLVLVTVGLLWLVFPQCLTVIYFSHCICDTQYFGLLQLKFNMEQGLPVLPDWLFFTRMNARARKDLEIGPAQLLLRYGS